MLHINATIIIVKNMIKPLVQAATPPSQGEPSSDLAPQHSEPSRTDPPSAGMESVFRIQVFSLILHQMGKCFQDGFTFPNCASRVLLSSPTLEMTSLNSSTALQFSAMLVFLIRKVSLRSPTCSWLNLEQFFILGQAIATELLNYLNMIAVEC